MPGRLSQAGMQVGRGVEVKRGFYRWFTLVLFIFGIVACKSSSPAPTGEPLPKPGLSPVPTVSSPKVIYQDDFSNPDSGWSRATQANGLADYDDGVYRILVNTPNTDIWGLAGRSFGDVRVEVDAFKVSGDRNNRFGIVCRASEAVKFYVFIISSDGYYGIGKIKGLDYQLIGMDAMLRSDKIPRGSGMIRLRADCVGNTLSLYVNDEMIYQTQDTEFDSGDAGLIAGTYSIPGTDIRFDNFEVLQP